MKRICFIICVCCWSLNAHAQFGLGSGVRIEEPSGYAIVGVSINNECEALLYAELASKAAASVADKELSSALSACAVNRGSSLVYRGVKYVNPLTDSYANTYWNQRNKLSCNQKASDQAQVMPNKPKTPDVTSPLGDDGNSSRGLWETQGAFNSYHTRNVEGNWTILDITEKIGEHINELKNKAYDSLEHGGQLKRRDRSSQYSPSSQKTSEDIPEESSKTNMDKCLACEDNNKKASQEIEEGDKFFTNRKKIDTL